MKETLTPVTLSVCEHCAKEFKPQRKTAQFCSSNCRVANHRDFQRPLKTAQSASMNEYHARRRSAVTKCSAGTSLLRDVGRTVSRRELMARKREAVRVVVRKQHAKDRKDAVARVRDIDKLIRLEIHLADIAIERRYSKEDLERLRLEDDKLQSLTSAEVEQWYTEQIAIDYTKSSPRPQRSYRGTGDARRVMILPPESAGTLQKAQEFKRRRKEFDKRWEKIHQQEVKARSLAEAARMKGRSYIVPEEEMHD